MSTPSEPAALTKPRVVILGGGPGGYEAALVAAQLGADVKLVERTGCGGAAVLTDVVPSKTLIATAEVMTLVDDSVELGVRFPGGTGAATNAEGSVGVDLGRVNKRVHALALAQAALAVAQIIFFPLAFGGAAARPAQHVPDHRLFAPVSGIRSGP